MTGPPSWNRDITTVPLTYPTGSSNKIFVIIYLFLIDATIFSLNKLLEYFVI